MGVMLCVTRAPKGQNAEFVVCLSWVTALFRNSEVSGLSTLPQDICRPLRKCFEENLGLKIVSRAVLCLQPSDTYLEMRFQIFACLLQTRYFIPDKYRNGRILTQTFLVAMKWCFVIKKKKPKEQEEENNQLLALCIIHCNAFLVDGNRPCTGTLSQLSALGLMHFSQECLFAVCC